MTFFLFLHIEEKNGMYLVTRSGSAQPAGTWRAPWRSGEFKTQHFLQGRGNKFPDGQHYITKLLQGKTSLDFVKRLPPHWMTRVLSRSWRGLTNSNGKYHFLTLSPSLVLSAPPQAVSVVQLTNSSSISVSWEPPPHNSQSGIVLEYKVSPRPVWQPSAASAEVERRRPLINNVCASFSLAAFPRVAV